jgi:hypothetical protein
VGDDALLWPRGRQQVDFEKHLLAVLHELAYPAQEVNAFPHCLVNGWLLIIGTLGDGYLGSHVIGSVLSADLAQGISCL